LIEVDGRPGIVYARVDGMSMLRELSERPWRAIAIARRLAELHTLIHQLSPKSASGLPRQRERLMRRLDETPLTDLQKEAIGRQLAQLPDGYCLCHGDFHPDNVIVTPNGEMIIDWTNASVGNPLGDAAWTSLVLRIGDPPAGSLRLLIRLLQHRFCQAYIERYSQLNPDARAQLGAWRLPIAVARLHDNISSERATLLSTIAELAQP
jgi:aminoglycoside phosphotransferase (APT) family kinase protein